MAHNLNAEVISIGTELLLGELTDTNSVYIARMLRDLGINLYYMTTVGDNQERISNAICAALSRAQVVITCGGLGPTVDDMTRQAVAEATRRGLVFHQHLLDQIATRFASFKVIMSENNRRQAYVPENALPIENPVGTAPAFIVEHGNGVVISLPGVPREMKYLMTQNVLPYLQNKYQLGIIKARTLKTAGIGESTLDDLLGHDILERSNPTVGLAAHSGQVDVRITAKADHAHLAEQMIAEVEQEIRARVGQFIFGADNDRLEVVLADYLKQYGETLAVVQAGIGDVVAAAIEKSGGGAVLAASRLFDDPHALRNSSTYPGATTLRELAAQAARQIRMETGAAAAIAIVSLPDVNEDADITEGTALAVCTDTQTRERIYGFGARSEVAREWVRSWTLSTAWRMLKEKFDAETK